ncbi:MAG: gliding motility-associated C-terminal domain-containing protein [Bacteroidota bacterium]
MLDEIQITSQPQDSDLIIGATAEFMVSVDFALDYQWQESTDNGNNWIDLTNINEYSGVNSPTLTINPIDITMNGNLYLCIISGNCNTISSSQAELSVFDSPDFVANFAYIIVCVDDTFSMACNVSNFLQIVNFTLSIEFDNSMLSFISVTDIAPEIAINTTVTTTGNTITVSWDSIQDITLPDGKLFNFTFSAFADNTSSLSWNHQLTNVTNQPGLQPTLILTDGDIVSNPLAIAPTNAYADNDTINIVDEINILLTAEGGWGDELIWSSNNCGGDTVGTGTPLEIMRPITTTTYYANWHNQCGSSQCSEVQIVILYNYNVGIPNAFTPNGDGLNDEFKVVSNTTLDDFRMQIFSRWGELIFESTDQLNGWDGIYKGNNLSTNSYFWKISYYFSNDGANYYNVSKTGTVMLIR